MSDEQQQKSTLQSGPQDVELVSSSKKPSVFDRQNVFECLDSQGNLVKSAEEAPPDHRRILVCIDDIHSSESQKTIEAVARLVKPGESVVLMTVLPQKLYNPQGFAPGIISPLLTQKDIQAELHALEQLRDLRVNELKSFVDQLPAEAHDRIMTHIAHDSDARDGIMQAIRFHQPVLVAVGRRSMGRWNRLISSASISSFLLHHSDSPVLIVKGDAPFNGEQQQAAK